MAATAEPTAGTSLTAGNNQDFAALLSGSDSDYDLIQAFATKYKGRTVEYDGVIAAVANHADRETRYDMLVLAGDRAGASAGPNFQFRDVGILDLRLAGPVVPDSVGIGDNLHVVARVGAFESASGLLLLEPVSTTIR